MVEDDDKIGEANAVTSVESEDGIAKLHNSFSKEFTIDPTTETTIRLDDRLRPNSTTLPTPGSLSAFTSSPLVQTAQGPRDSAQDDEEQWEITAIIGKRRIRKRSRGYEYEVRWKNTWLRRDDLRNAQELLRNFESGRPQEMAKWCANKSLGTRRRERFKAALVKKYSRKRSSMQLDIPKSL